MEGGQRKGRGKEVRKERQGETIGREDKAVRKYRGRVEGEGGGKIKKKGRGREIAEEG